MKRHQLERRMFEMFVFDVLCLLYLVVYWNEYALLGTLIYDCLDWESLCIQNLVQPSEKVKDVDLWF